MNDFISELLSLLAKYESTDSIWWNESLSFFVNCNDLFAWATADCEEVTQENLPELRGAFEDCRALGYVETAYAGSLFCCRVRKMRPQNACYPQKYPNLWPLFDACGPERAVDFLNPRQREAVTA